MDKKSIPLVVITYLIWIIVAAGAVLLMFSGRTALLTVFARYSLRGFSEKMAVGALDKGYIVIAGLLAVGISIISENNLIKAGSWRSLAKRASMWVGAEFATLTVCVCIIQIGRGGFLTSFVSAIAFFAPLLAATIAFICSRLLKDSNKIKK